MRSQTYEQQAAACRAYCEQRGWEVVRIAREKMSTKKTRPVKEDVLRELRQGKFDVLVLFRLDRWARTLVELVLEVEDLHSRGVHVVSLHETVDTSSAMGRAMLQLVGVFAQLERDLHAEATRERLAALKAMGKKLGRPSVMDDSKAHEARRLRAQGQPYREIARTLGVGYGTVRRACEGSGEPKGGARKGPRPRERPRA